MERDMRVTVTRDSRVSHATTTTPHPSSVCYGGLFLQDQCFSAYDRNARTWLPRRPATLAGPMQDKP